MLEVWIWNVSVFPKIIPVDAVGIHAVVSEFLTPSFFIFSLKVSQSHISEGLAPHISNWNWPSDKGDPLNVE